MFDWAFFKTPRLIQGLFPALVWRVDTKEKVIYPTFDDGPNPELTPRLLAILQDFDASATFFCVGDNIRKFPTVFDSIIEQGHAVGNHTFNHLKSWKTKKRVFLENVNLCQQEIEKHLEPETKLFRFPYGQYSYSIAQALIGEGYELVMWDVLSKDYKPSISSQEILEKSIEKSSDGSIIVFHDNLKAKDKIIQFLPLYFKHFSDIGYKFRKL